MSDAQRLKSIEHNGVEVYPVYFNTDDDSPAMIIFYDDPDELLRHYPDIPPTDGLSLNDCSGEMLKVSMYNLDVLNDRDLISLESPDAGFAWTVNPDNTLEIIDGQSGELVCSMPDNEKADINAKLLVQGRAALHWLHCIYTILQREAVYDPDRYRNLTDLLTTVLTEAGYDNVMTID